MTTTIPLKKCQLCVKRMRTQGGNQTCSLFRIRKFPVGMNRDGSPKLAPVSDADAWTEHLASFPNGCQSFKLGDLKPRKARPGADDTQEALF